MKATIRTDTPAEQPKLVSNKEYARRIGVTPRTLFNYIERGVLPSPTIINGRKFWDPQMMPRGDEIDGREA